MDIRGHSCSESLKLESPKLLTYIYLGQTVVKSHDGPGVTRSIIDELSSWNIQGDYVEGRSFRAQ